MPPLANSRRRLDARTPTYLTLRCDLKGLWVRTAPCRIPYNWKSSLILLLDSLVYFLPDCLRAASWPVGKVESVHPPSIVIVEPHSR